MTPADLPNERGSAKYFHGREEIITSLDRQLEIAVREEYGGGTIFVVQGPPGAGKTALLDHCRKRAALRKWQTANIGVTALSKTEEMKERLGRKWYEAMKGIRVGGEILSLPATLLRVDFNQNAHSPLQAIRGSRKPLLLILDEAQRLWEENAIPKDLKGEAMDLLECIHNGKTGRPVVLLVAGLGMTRLGLKKLGISRYEDGCFFEMGGLSQEEELAVICDWLFNEGRLSINEIPPWADAITQETHGWPQHIMAYVKSALVQIDGGNRELKSAGLKAMLSEGRKRREFYYKSRAAGLGDNERISLARIIAEAPLGRKLIQKDILQKLSAEYGREKAEELFQIACADGIFYEEDGGFTVPVPSMSDWFLNNYFPDRGDDPGLER